MFLHVASCVFPILLLPAIGFLLIFLGGKTAIMQRHGDKLATLVMCIVWLLGCNVFLASMQNPEATWSALPADVWTIDGWLTPSTSVEEGLKETPAALTRPEELSLRIGFAVDHFTAIMLFVVTSVSFFVHLFSMGYMKGEIRYTRFFCILQVFTAAMLMVVLADNLLLLYIGWEIMGFSSYSLIGHYWEKKSAQQASMKAFMTTRLGDVLMFVGFMIIWAQVGSMRYEDINAAVASGTFDMTWRLWAGILVFFGGVGKSAQFPLHVWLPDAMEGPTPVSALIHAATMVAAGVYLVARCILIMTPETLLFIAYVGGFTALFAATIAVVQDDIKKVLAYSTISQLGYMMLGLGLAGGLTSYGYSYGSYHLVTHAFFKACLFLGSGSIIHAMHHEQRMSKYGGLWKKLPFTFATFLIATLCLCGFPFTSGFYSKDGIIASAIEYGWLTDTTHIMLPIFAVTAAAFTTFYMMRLMFLTFAGKPRDQHAYDHAHESPIMYIPLIYLAAVALALGAGHGQWFKDRIKPPKVYASADAKHYDKGHDTHGAKEHDEHAAALPYDGFEPVSLATGAAAAKDAHGDAHGHGHDDKHLYHQAHKIASMGSYFIVAFFTLLAALFYAPFRIFNPEKVKNAFPWLHSLLWNKYYFDELYLKYIVGPTMALCDRIFKFDADVVDGVVNATGRAGLIMADSVGEFDKNVVDGAVNSVARSTNGWGGVLARWQTGNIRHYIMGVIGGVSMMIIVFLFFPEEMAELGGAIREGFLLVGQVFWDYILVPLSNLIYRVGVLVGSAFEWLLAAAGAIGRFFLYLGHGAVAWIEAWMRIFNP